jgi:hypothetical protein
MTSAEMKTNNPAAFHKMYGTKKPKVTYYARDFIDYALMILASAAVVVFSYGLFHVMSLIGLALCAFELITFIARHGIELRIPVVLRRPQDVLYLLIYKIQNLRPMYFMALGLLLAQNVVVIKTPNLPHYAGVIRIIALSLFFIHFASITIYRTVILADHLRKRELVREVLMKTPWRRAIHEKTNIMLEIFHAYCTGVLTHIILIAPWYLVTFYSRFSVLFLPILFWLNLKIHMKWVKAFNAWFYRDHWLAHNSECEFILLHGTHHDAIPSGLIAVAENGFLEGFTRFAIGSPVAFYNPVLSFMIYTREIQNDINLHQYIPGVFPRLSRTIMEVFQHARHHYGQLEPYGIAIKVDQPGAVENYQNVFPKLPDELRNSAKLDEELTGFKWDNPSYRQILQLWDEYQKQEGAEASVSSKSTAC